MLATFGHYSPNIEPFGPEAPLGPAAPAVLTAVAAEAYTVDKPTSTPTAPHNVASLLNQPIIAAVLTATETPTATELPSPTATATLAPTHPPIPQETLFDLLLKPFVAEAQNRRAARAANEPDYARRVDARLGAGRVNFHLFGYGQTFEPPSGDGVVIGSDTIVSYDTHNGKVDLISLTHDIRAPEIEQVLSKQRTNVPAVKIDQAYSVGGFGLMRNVIEDATGLSVDYQIAFKDIVIKNLIDNLFGEIEVSVPATFDVASFYLDGKRYDGAHFAQGRQVMNSTSVMQFIKALPSVYNPTLERNVRKQIVFLALLDALNKNCADRGLWLKLSAFIAGELLTGDISYDFDPISLLLNNLGNLIPDLGKVGQNRACGIGAQRINQTRYIVDAGVGDGGVQWAANNAETNPITKKDLQAGIYGLNGGGGHEVPLDANPYGDLITQYWTSVRGLVKRALSPRTTPQ